MIDPITSQGEMWEKSIEIMEQKRMGRKRRNGKVTKNTKRGKISNPSFYYWGLTFPLVNEPQYSVNAMYQEPE